MKGEIPFLLQILQFIRVAPIGHMTGLIQGLDILAAVAADAGELPVSAALQESILAKAESLRHSDPKPRPRIAIIKDSAFQFYYPENIEALEAAGGEEAPVAEEEAVDAPSDASAPVEMVEMVEVARSDDSEEAEKSEE